MVRSGNQPPLEFLVRNVAAFAGIFATLGATLGFVVGLLANPATAWFAVIELGLPAAILGATLGLVVGLLMLLIRRTG